MVLKSLKLQSAFNKSVLTLMIMLLTFAVMALSYSSIQTRLAQQNILVDGLAQRLHNRLDKFRSITNQLFNSLSDKPDVAQHNPVMLPLRPEFSALDKGTNKTETLVYGTHDASTVNIATQLTDFLDILWGGSKNNWNMYYLNGQDNSLTLVSTLPLKAMLRQHNAHNLTSLLSSRKAELLQQANKLDERESFSSIRRFLNPGANFYITMRTTFNQPGRLATVLAFDIPVSDLMTESLDINNLQLQTDDSTENDTDTETSLKTSWQLNMSGFSLDISTPLSGNALSLVYHVPLWSVISHSIHDFISVYLLLIVMLLIVLTRQWAYQAIIQQPIHRQETKPDLFRNMNREIVQYLPLGFVIYDIQQHVVVLSNEQAEQLIEHLNLQDMIDLSDESPEIIQVTINNEIYEVRQQTSRVIPNYRLITVRELDRELLINKRLQHAQQLLEQNKMIRKRLFTQLGQSLTKPLQQLSEGLRTLYTLTPLRHRQGLALQLQQITSLVDDVIMVNQIENNELTIRTIPFSFPQLLDDIIEEIHPLLQHKGIELLVNNACINEAERAGDSVLIKKMILLLLDYSLSQTHWGKLTIQISASSEHTDRLIVNIIDTGEGLDRDQLQNADFPFSATPLENDESHEHGMTLFLCRRIAKLLQGHIQVNTNLGIGASYLLEISLPFVKTASEPEEKLLDGVTILVDIVVDEVRRIAYRNLEHWGARCLSAEERFSGQQHDLMVTDDKSRLCGWGVLLTNDSSTIVTAPEQRQANYNINRQFSQAIFSLIENKMAVDDMEGSVAENTTDLWLQPEYFQMFEYTVPDDIDKLYTEIEHHDYAALSLTAHRLKGVFAMLNLEYGRTKCEQLEQHIHQRDNLNIQRFTSELEEHVRALLQQGRKQYE